MNIESVLEDLHVETEYPNKNNYHGQIISGWRVLRYVKRNEHNRKSKSAHWLCRCEACGAERLFASNHLKTGSVRRCNHGIKPERVSYKKLKAENELLRQRVEQLEKEIREVRR